MCSFTAFKGVVMNVDNQKGGDTVQYNFHNEKYQTKDVIGIHREQFREIADHSKYKNNVDPEKTDQNVYEDLAPEGRNWYGVIKTAKESTVEKTGRAVRKDAVVLCSTVESVPPSWPQEVSTQYFRDKAQWYKDFLEERAGLDPGSMRSLVIHYDETSPHATYDWIPMKDGRLQAKNILTKEILQRVQDEGQKFTMEWVDSYNRQHPGHQLEKLEPSGMGVKRQYLDDLSYKRMKDEAAIAALQVQHSELTEIVAVASEKLNEVKQETFDQLTLQKVSEKRAEAAEIRYSELVEKITGAPDLASYETVTNQNESLREELSLKDKLIEKLQDSVRQWKENAEMWRDRFVNVARSFGTKLMSFAGYDVSRLQDVPEYPTSAVSAGLADLRQDKERLDPTSLRIVSDSEHPGMYCIVHRTDTGDYQVVKDGFSDRDAASEWRRNYSGFALSVTEDMTKSRSHTINP